MEVILKIGINLLSLLCNRSSLASWLHVSLKFLCWNLSAPPQRRQGLWEVINKVMRAKPWRMSALIKEAPQNSLVPFSMERWETCSPEEGPHPTVLAPRLPASRTVRNKFLPSLNHPVCDVLWQQPEQTRGACLWETHKKTSLYWWNLESSCNSFTFFYFPEKFPVLKVPIRGFH